MHDLASTVVSWLRNTSYPSALNNTCPSNSLTALRTTKMDLVLLNETWLQTHTHTHTSSRESALSRRKFDSDNTIQVRYRQ